MPDGPRRARRLPDPGPGRPAKKLSPFVTDTLFPAVGGAFPINRASILARPTLEDGTEIEAYTRFQPDTLTVLFGNPSDHVVAHEAGHMLDARALAPAVAMDVEDRRHEYRNPRDYFGSNSSEYVAEAFARAVDSGRHAFTDSTAADRQFPGTIQYIRWLKTRPPFAAADSAAAAPPAIVGRGTRVR